MYAGENSWVCSFVTCFRVLFFVTSAVHLWIFDNIKHENKTKTELLFSQFSGPETWPQFSSFNHKFKWTTQKQTEDQQLLPSASPQEDKTWEAKTKVTAAPHHVTFFYNLSVSWLTWLHFLFLLSMGEAKMQENSFSESWSSSGRRDRNWAGGGPNTTERNKSQHLHLMSWWCINVQTKSSLKSAETSQTQVTSHLKQIRVKSQVSWN